MTYEFYKELAELVQKHKLTLISGPSDNLVKTTKGFKGNMMFITNGEKKIELQGGESMIFGASTTILLNKRRFRG